MIVSVGKDTARVDLMSSITCDVGAKNSFVSFTLEESFLLGVQFLENTFHSDQAKISSGNRRLLIQLLGGSLDCYDLRSHVGHEVS